MKNDKKALETTLFEIEGKRNRESFPGMIAGAYALWLARQNNSIDIEDLPVFLKGAERDALVRLFIIEELRDHWDKYRPFLTSFDQKLLKEVIIESVPQDCHSEFSHTPKGVLELVTKLLGITPDEYVADLGTGAGEFLCHAYSCVPEAHYWGDEIATRPIAISKIRAKVLGGDITVVQENMFDPSKDASKKFDKLFCFPPLGLRSIRMPWAENFMKSQPASLPKLKGTVSGEWLFALKMLSCLKEGGKAVLAMAPGGLFNMPDNGIRRYLLERQLVEAVILLPARLFDFSAIPIALVVFSKNNSKVHMIDASEMGERMRRGAVLTDEDITQIVSAVNGKKYTWNAMVDYRDVIVHGNMDPSYHTLEHDIKLNDAVDFECIIKEILRGAQLTSSELESLTSEKPTNFQYLALSSIKNGMIDSELPYLTSIDNQLLRYCLQQNDIILSKIGAPFKVALATSASPQKILGNGNLFIIRVDAQVADPCYIKVFLESELGQSILRRAAGGSIMPNLSVEAIKRLQISLPPLDQQKQIAARYLAKADEVILLRRKLDAALNALGHILDSDDGVRA